MLCACMYMYVSGYPYIVCDTIAPRVQLTALILTNNSWKKIMSYTCTCASTQYKTYFIAFFIWGETN